MTGSALVMPSDSMIEAGTCVELFTGGGGLAIALRDSRFRHLLTVENNTRACETLRLNGAHAFDDTLPEPADIDDPWPLIAGDIQRVDFTRWHGAVDVVAGGVPCQPWSLGGLANGFEDQRNLWPELFRCVREVRPRAVIAENVKGLLRPSFKPYYDYILCELSAPFEQRHDGESWRDHDQRLRRALSTKGSDENERYDVSVAVVNAADYGVPQVRWRVFVVAFRRDLRHDNWRFPDPTHSRVALLREQAGGSYWERHGIPERIDRRPMRVPDADGKKPWQTMRDAFLGLPQPLADKVEHPDWLHHYGWPGAREYPGHTANDLDRPAKTVKAGVHGVAGGESILRRDDGTIRYMSVREVARLMTFPDRWRLAGPRGEQMRQLGNAVPVDLGAVVADSVARVLKPTLAVCEKQTAGGIAMSSKWRDAVPEEMCWRASSDLTKTERSAEQDAAASGGRRKLRLPDGHVATASVYFRFVRGGRRVYGYLRWSIGRKTHEEYLCQAVDVPREENLRRAWVIAHQRFDFID